MISHCVLQKVLSMQPQTDKAETVRNLSLSTPIHIFIASNIFIVEISNSTPRTKKNLERIPTYLRQKLIILNDKVDCLTIHINEAGDTGSPKILPTLVVLPLQHP